VNIHATTVDLAGLGVLLLGNPGSGKSDLALRLISDGALLVADDRTIIDIDGLQMMARGPTVLEGLIEVRGIGILPAAVMRQTVLRLAVVLAPGVVERMPPERFWALPDTPEVKIPSLMLDPFEASAPAKVRKALRKAVSG
jgi:serine kinase of HPr protein (carbohydrate metabolism regulator)